MMEHYHISGVPICDPSGKLQGIITNRDLRFETNLNKQIKECMIGEGLVTAPVGTSLEEAKNYCANTVLRNCRWSIAKVILKG